jgi:hypothetical protein
LRIHAPSSHTCTPGIENISIHRELIGTKLLLTYASMLLDMYLFAP